jgi:trimeric autotransporter adhesin
VGISQPYEQTRLSLNGNLLEYDLYLTGSLRDQVEIELKKYSFSIPPNTFRHSNPNEQLKYGATQLDGSPLPSWISFNPNTLKFLGMPPKNVVDTIVKIMVKASDRYGNEVSATFKVTVKRERMDTGRDNIKLHGKQHQSKHHPTPISEVGNQHAVKLGKLSFNEQLNSESKLTRLKESRALLNSLNQL